MPLYYIYYICIHTKITFIHLHLPRHLSVFFIAVGSAGKSSWGAELRFELGPALQQADVLTVELRRTPQLSYVASLN